MSMPGEHLKDKGSKTQSTIAGAVAGLIARFVIAPLDVVKIRLQLQTHSLSDPLTHHPSILRGSPIYKGTLPTLLHILRNEGITGLWKGNIPAELMYVSYSAIQFTTYRSIPVFLHQIPGSQHLPSAAESFISGATAGAVSTTITYPLDLLRTRFAAQGVEKVYASLLGSIRDIYKHEGPTGYFRGLGAGVGQIVPYMGIFFSVYETLRLPLSRLSVSLPTTPVSQSHELSLGSSSDALAGIMASVIAKTSVFPLDLIRKRLQVQGPTRERYVHRNIPVYKGVFGTMRRIVRKEGLRGSYRGLTVSLMKAAPASAVTMWTYERALKLLIDRDILGETRKRD